MCTSFPNCPSLVSVLPFFLKRRRWNKHTEHPCGDINALIWRKRDGARAIYTDMKRIFNNECMQINMQGLKDNLILSFINLFQRNVLRTNVQYFPNPIALLRESCLINTE